MSGHSLNRLPAEVSAGPAVVLPRVAGSAALAEDFQETAAGRIRALPALNSSNRPAAFPAGAESEPLLAHCWRGELRFCAGPDYDYRLHCLRQMPRGWDSEIGLPVDGGRTERPVEFRLRGGFRLRAEPGESGWRLRLWALAGATLLSNARPEAEVLPAADFAPELLRTLVRLLQPGPEHEGEVEGLARRIGARAPEAVRRSLTAELARELAPDADALLLAGTFDPGPETDRVLWALLGGDAVPLWEAAGPGGARLAEGVLPRVLAARRTLELVLPLFDRARWEARWRLLSGARVQAREHGRILVTLPGSGGECVAQAALALAGALSGRHEGLCCCFTERRELDGRLAPRLLEPLARALNLPEAVPAASYRPGMRVRLELTLSAPGANAAAWLRAPREATMAHRQFFAPAAVAVQRALRLWLPFCYFSELNRYDSVAAAFPLLVYQCSSALRSRNGADLTYDIADGRLSLPRQTTLRNLAAEMARAGTLLKEHGRPKSWRPYRWNEPHQVLAMVERHPARYNALVSADTEAVDSVVDLGAKGRELTLDPRRDPQRLLARGCRYAQEFAKQLERRMRRLYGPEDLSRFASLVLVEAMSALPPHSASPAVTVRVETGEGEAMWCARGTG